MLLEGLKLMVVGMSTVLLFLVFTIFLLQLVSRLTHQIALREQEEIERSRRALEEKRKKTDSALSALHGPLLDDEEEIAVITAAIAAFEAEKAAAS